MTPGIVLLWGPRGGGVLMSEVPLELDPPPCRKHRQGLKMFRPARDLTRPCYGACHLKALTQSSAKEETSPDKGRSTDPYCLRMYRVASLIRNSPPGGPRRGCFL